MAVSNAEHRAELTCEIIVRGRSIEISISALHQPAGGIGSIRAAEGIQGRQGGCGVGDRRQQPGYKDS